MDGGIRATVKTAREKKCENQQLQVFNFRISSRAHWYMCPPMNLITGRQAKS